MDFDMDRVPYKADLAKTPATYYVIADDEGACSGAYGRTTWTPERYVLDVQRASDHPVEQELQRTDFTQACFESHSPLLFLTIEAVSHGHAATVAKQQFALDRDFQALQDVFFADELAFDAAAFGDTAS
ncbi:hypothetical protein OG725_37195 (plasmid) [Streptomyces sp. NBC_01213]|uniref:hypothetical protein n=1 Tax=Streptomyces sp. NBC_01213 TaxID=2903776 RepID=UPI002F918238|nr:hypothetical protein OG725_37195 [Streptomyces sp. NBC_01213]